VPKPADAQPPSAPHQISRLRLATGQRIGLSLMALVPLLALVGVFGERRESREAAHGSLVLRAEEPTRLRYRQRMTLDLSVANRGTAIVDDVRVRLDSSYLARFSNVSITPSTGPDGAVSLGALAPGGSARLAVTLEGERSGTHHGLATATDAAGDTTRLMLTATVFP
jgi:hypothetical protein